MLLCMSSSCAKLTFYSYLGVQDAGVGQRVVGQYIRPVVDQLQRKIHGRDGARGDEASSYGRYVGEEKQWFLRVRLPRGPFTR